MQGRGGRGDDEEQRRRRQGGAPGPNAPDYSGYFAAGATAVAAAALGYGAYKLLSGGQQNQLQAEEQMSHDNVRQTQRAPWYSGWFDNFKFKNARNLFWQKVKEEEEQEISEIKDELCQIVPEAAVHYKHKYNKFDDWFKNLLRNVLRIKNDERREFVEAFDEVLEVLLKEMGEADLLFRHVYRTYAPAGSSWEDLRICKPDEFDVNLILLPADIQENVKVEDVGSGHIAIRLDNGFDINENKLQKKFKDVPEDRFKSHCVSIKALLRNWVENSYVSRSKVMSWMQGAVDKALLKLKQYEWTHVEWISRSTSGPAVTINVRMKNAKAFSVDLVPAFEFNQKHLPDKTKDKVRAKQIDRTWYAIPKGPTTASHNKMWRTSLYQAERDIMTGQYHLKPCIRIMKRLRDEQQWKDISSYYLKTKFMWMMDNEPWHMRQGLGQKVMWALTNLRDALQDHQIYYYWDDELNLLDRCDKEFSKNVSRFLTKLIQEFDKSLVDDNVNPMRRFGCDKNGNLLRDRYFNEAFEVVRSQTHQTSSPSSSNEADCVVM